MKQKKFLSLYAEHSNFLLRLSGWIVIKIYTHCTFEQSKFKKDSVIMNQVSRQNVKMSVEKGF